MPPAAPNVQAEEMPAKRGLASKLLRALLILLLIAAITVGVSAFLLLQKKNDVATPLADEPVAAQSDFKLNTPPSFLSLDPFVVNLLSENGERYLQVVMTLRVADQKTIDALTMFVPEVRHRINLRLAGKLPSEIAGPSGREQLAEELKQDINRSLAPAFGNPQIVQAVLFNNFIIQ